MTMLKFPGVMERARRRHQRLAAKQKPLKVAAASCAVAAASYTKRCCEEGLDALIVEDAHGRCSLEALPDPCPAFAAGVCGWKRGKDACVGWDPRVHPLTAAPRCQTDARRADVGQAPQTTAAAAHAAAATADNSDVADDDDDDDIDAPDYEDDFDADGDNIRLDAPCDLTEDEQAVHDLEQEIIEHFDDEGS